MRRALSIKHPVEAHHALDAPAVHLAQDGVRTTILCKPDAGHEHHPESVSEDISARNRGYELPRAPG